MNADEWVIKKVRVRSQVVRLSSEIEIRPGTFLSELTSISFILPIQFKQKTLPIHPEQIQLSNKTIEQTALPSMMNND